MKAFKLKEDICLYDNEEMLTKFITIKARSVIDFSATYDVFDAVLGNKLGAFKRKGLKSLIKDEWIILDKDDNEIGIITEDSMVLALIRRILLNLIPQEYNVSINGEQVCKYKQNFNPFVSKINVDFSMDSNNKFDKRLGIAGGILLCAIEGKQG
jgi:hypothetical protein